MERGELTKLIRRLFRQYPQLQNDSTLLYATVCKMTAPAGYRPNPASVVRIFYRIKQSRRRGD